MKELQRVWALNLYICHWWWGVIGKSGKAQLQESLNLLKMQYWIFILMMAGKGMQVKEA